MTAEVAVLNKSSIALAADSAMTIRGMGKMYPTNKLFALSKHQPVGIMVYNSAQFMEIPWETLIKMYRSHRGTAAKPAVSDYLRDFFAFICDESICNEQQQTINLLRIVRDIFGYVVEQHQRQANANRRIDQTESLRLAIDRIASNIAAFEVAESMNGLNHRDLMANRQLDIRRTAEQYFPGCNINAAIIESLCALIVRCIKSNRLSDGYSGIVVAGFGQSEICPTLIEARTDGMISGRLKAICMQVQDIGRLGTDAAIVPFAQREMVDRFMLGTDPEFLDYLRAYVPHMLWQSIEAVVGPLADDLRAGIQRVLENHVGDFQTAVREFQESRFTKPIIDVVKYLPKEELANMAESLIGLTSLKRRVSSEMESVGGPVDVALISKGDGFIWIKRKHYFDVALNVDYTNRQSVPVGNQHRSNP